MLRTLQIVGNSPFGGASYLIIEWCRYLLEQGWSVDVLATDSFFIKRLQSVPGVRVLDTILIPREISPIQHTAAFYRLFRLLRKRQYEVVHTYTATPGFLGRVAGRMAGAPAIFHHQAGWTINDYSSLMKGMLFRPLEFLATMASTRGICVSYATKDQANYLRIAPSRKLITICNGIDAKPFIEARGKGSRIRKALGIPKRTVLIGNTARLAAQKDNETLIKAMKELEFLQIYNYRLALAGDGPDRAKLEKLAADLGLGAKVSMLGFVDNVPGFLDALDIFVSPSLWEGLSVSIMEAMAAAKPIVTSSIAPNAELIEHEANGLLVPPKSPAQFAQAIARFVREPKLAEKCAEAARCAVTERFTLDRMFRETEDLYHEALGNKGLGSAQERP